MEIKPTGPGSYPQPASDGAESTEKLRPADVAATESAPTAAGEPLAAIAAQFHKADLQDPAKVEDMLSQCAGQLLGSALDRMKGPVPAGDQKYLADWLRNDPYIRGKLLNYLERVLK
jgi:hypothetical protein